MSLVLDTLRGERGRSSAQTNDPAAQTNTVLQTLGCDPPRSPFRLGRLLGYVAVAIAAALTFYFLLTF